MSSQSPRVRHAWSVFSLKKLLAGVAFCAVGLAALLGANDLWTSALMFVVVIALLTSVVAIVFYRGAAQAFWIGFAVFGWGYFWAAHWHDINGKTWTLDRAASGSGALLTTELLYIVYADVLPRVRDKPVQPPAFGGPGFEGFGGGGGFFQVSPSLQNAINAAAPPPESALSRSTATTYPNQEQFIEVGHYLFTLLLAYFGGRLALFLHARARRHEANG